MKKYNLSTIMKRAWELVKKFGLTISDGLKKAWGEAKKMTKNAVIESYESFNARRYSDPWVALVSENGKLDFSKKVGTYTGGYKTGDAGDLVVFDPIEGATYAYGQKDYRGNNGGYEYVKFENGCFVRA